MLIVITFLHWSSPRRAVPTLTVCSVYFVAAIYTSHVLKTKRKIIELSHAVFL